MRLKKIPTIILLVALLLISTMVYVFASGKSSEKEQYIVSLSLGDSSDVQRIRVGQNGILVRPEDPLREGYIFDGWLLNGVPYNFDMPISGDIRLEASWKKIEEDETIITYSVTFDTVGGSDIGKITVKSGNKITKPLDPIKVGYEFKGWLFNNQTYSFNTSVTNDMVLVANWEIESETTTKYKITFDTDGGSAISSLMVKSGDKLNKPTNPAKSGYSFKEWQLDGKAYDFSKTVTSNITLKAIYTKTNTKNVTITFDSDGGSTITASTINSGDKVSKPTNPMKNGYSFKEWQLNGSAYDFNKVVTSDITLKAIYSINLYKVTFNSSGGSDVSAQTITHGNKVSKPNDPTRSGYIFKGWLSEGATYDFDRIITADIMLTATWEMKPTYTMTILPIGSDIYSPDYQVKVYANGNDITPTVQYLYDKDGVQIAKYVVGINILRGNKAELEAAKTSGTITVKLSNSTIITIN